MDRSRRLETTITNLKENTMAMDIEQRIDSALQQEASARTEGARAALRARFVEEERLAQEAQAQAETNAARAAYLKRAEAAYPQACAEYKKAVDAFRAARCRLQALDTILNRVCFSTHSLGIELRHQFAAPDETDVHPGYAAAVASIRKSLGG
jgi:multidrug efflux pump subunit AcrA (membrane-fusion protein)